MGRGAKQREPRERGRAVGGIAQALEAGTPP